MNHVTARCLLASLLFKEKTAMAVPKRWRPPDFRAPDRGIPKAIIDRFKALYPERAHGDLAGRISRYWIEKLKTVWDGKPEALRQKDIEYNPDDPLSRIEQRTVLITYADSVRDGAAATMEVLDEYLRTRFPAIGGLHLLPPCEMAEDRFNDGGFSQIRRDRIHVRFGTNAYFAGLMENYYSMTDLVLNHVDIGHPMFQRYLAGDDMAGRCFYVFTEPAYQKQKAMGDFDAIFRPRPFPLFTIFRRAPSGGAAGMTHHQRVARLNRRFVENGLAELAGNLIDLLCFFDKIKNDQMLLDDDHAVVAGFRDFLAAATALDPDRIFGLSTTQETRHPPYIFAAGIQTIEDLLGLVLPAMGGHADRAGAYAKIFRSFEAGIFGEPIRALTTFSHVQVDLNTTTFEGLKLLVDDFAWYLGMDLNMLRLDAANFAFKKWGTSCFGLQEVRRLMEILYLTMDAVSPRMVPNLEVNAPLAAVLEQMADPKAPPPMMYDFHLACMMPAVFNAGDARALVKIGPMVGGYDIPDTSIRFSLDESHDGKSVSGIGGPRALLTHTQRRDLMDVVRANGGRVKFKSAPREQMMPAEFSAVCKEIGLVRKEAARSLFANPEATDAPFRLKDGIGDAAGMARALGVDAGRMGRDAALEYLAARLLEGKEPYELCIATRDALVRVGDPVLEVRRYLALKTLAFALMGRHVKAIYFNDLMGLQNDPDLVRRTGELRNIKRTRSERAGLESLLDDPGGCEYWIARLMNNTIALVDSDPALHPTGKEAQVSVDPALPSVARVLNACGAHRSLIVVNTAAEPMDVSLNRAALGPDTGMPFENLARQRMAGVPEKGGIPITLSPFERLWLSREPIPIPEETVVAVGSMEEMTACLGGAVH
jgi:hypothetical protein